VPVLFHLTEEFIFHEASVVIAIKSDEGVFYVDVGYEHHLLIGRGNLVVPLLDNNCIERNGLIILFGGIGASFISRFTLLVNPCTKECPPTFVAKLLAVTYGLWNNLQYIFALNPDLKPNIAITC
jgi:hypothetical protein